MARRSRYMSKTSLGPSVTEMGPTSKRKMRYPKHQWRINFRPYQIHPCAIAPVMAGDTIKHLRFESRVLSDPIVDQITGWWSELYFFYVRFSDLDCYADAQTLAITTSDKSSGTPAGGYGAISTSSKAWTMHNGHGPDWLYECMQAIALTYFRPETGAWDDYLLDGVPSAGLVGQTWLDTLTNTADLPAADNYYKSQEPFASATAGTDLDTYAVHWQRYEQLRKAKLVTMDYPEFLRSQGVDVPQQLKEPLSEKRRPELLRFTRQFAYPSNTVKEDGTGTVAAVSWVTAERMDRPIFCDEPGFVVGCQLVRPKVYRAFQTACGVSLLRDARTICPDITEDAPQMSLVNYGDTEGVTALGPLDLTDASINGWYADVNGLYVLGDQFVVGSAPTVDLPVKTTLQHTYPPDADVDALFVDIEAATIKADGMLSLSVNGRKTLGISPQAYTD